MSNALPVACFAPPLTDDQLAEYETRIAAVPPGELREALDRLLACVAAWWKLPESKRRAENVQTINHKGRDVRFGVTPMEADHVQQLWDVTPWMRELDALSTPRDDGLFDALQGELRNAAFHLLWHAKEITLDREPMTLDKLGA